MRVSGIIVVDLEHEGEQLSVELTSERPALLVSAPIWARQTYEGEAPALVVYCDTAYDELSYIQERGSKRAELHLDGGTK